MPINGSGDQWGWAEMEELLQCPVCFESPSKGVVEQCRSGHHICSVCKPKVENCPLCKTSYTGTRNYVVEEIMRNLETLKNIMLLTAVTTETSETKKKIKPKEKPLAGVPKVKTNLLPTPLASKGGYPCMFSTCNEILPVSRLVNHVRSSHSTLYTEGSLDAEGTFKITFLLFTSNASPLYKWQKVIFINGIGLVFFNYVLLKNSYMIATVQMAAKRQIAQGFKCKLEFKNLRGTDYKEVIRLTSTRDKMENILYRESCMLLTKRQMKALRQQNKANVTLEFSIVTDIDRFGGNYTRLHMSNLKELLSFYNTHDKKSISTCSGSVVL